jgi:hypothetical protein
MDYSAASSIRGTKLSSLIADRIMSGGSVGSSIKGALSDRMKAKAMGVKERYDPLNIAKKLTGGGSLAPALLGRMMGRSKEDIQYFAGKGTATALGHETGNIGGGSVDVLNRILSFLQKSHEIDVRTMQIKNNFQEEAMNEDDRRHKEFLNALKAFASGGTATPIGGGGKTGGGFNLLDLFADLQAKIKQIMDFVDELKWLRGIGSLAGLATAVYGIMLSPFMVAAADKKAIDADLYNPKYDNVPYAMSERAKKAGGSMTEGQAGKGNMASAMRGALRQEIEEVVASDKTDAELVEEYGKDRAELKKWLEQNKSPASRLQLPVKFSPTRSTKSGGDLTAMPSSTPMIEPSGGSTGSTPMTSMAPSSGVSEATNANIDLNLEQSTPSGGGASTPIVTNTTNNMGNQKFPASTTASQRDSTDILLHIYGALNKAGFI